MEEDVKIVKKVDDLRASQDIGSAIFIRRPEDTKYHLWLPVTNMPATGSAPATADSTVTTSRVNTQTPARKTIDQKEFTYFAHRDNFAILKKDYHQQRDFLQVNPDGTGWVFSGQVDTYQDETSVNNNLTAKGVITVASAEELPRENIYDLIEDTVTFPSSIPAQVFIVGTGTKVLNIDTDPATATITAKSDAVGVATVQASEKQVTITGVAGGSAIITITATLAGCYNGETRILVIVEEE